MAHGYQFVSHGKHLGSNGEFFVVELEIGIGCFPSCNSYIIRHEVSIIMFIIPKSRGLSDTM